jgi:hypothetical protein
MFCSVCGKTFEGNGSACPYCGKSKELHRDENKNSTTADLTPVNQTETVVQVETLQLAADGSTKSRTYIQYVLFAVVFVVLAIAVLLWTRGTSDNLTYKGIKLGDSKDKVEQQLGVGRDLDMGIGLEGLTQVIYEDTCGLIYKEGIVVGILPSDSSTSFSNGLPIQGTVRDLVDKLGASRLKVGGGGNLIFYQNGDVTLGFPLQRALQESVSASDHYQNIIWVKTSAFHGSLGFDETLADAVPLKYVP